MRCSVKVAHSFVLYLFSLTASHVHQPDGLPARPESHALITMGIPLLQSTIFHVLCISKKYSNHRLIPTAIMSFLGLIHFYATLILRGYSAVLPPLMTSRPKESGGDVFSGTGFRSSYPLMNYFSCVIESALLLVILLTVFLNAVIQLLVNGRVDRVFTTLGIAASGGITNNPESHPTQFSWSDLPFEEEWGVVLMRIGTASLEATGLKGWGNEVAPISAPVRARSRNLRRRGRNAAPPPPQEPSITYGSVRMGRSGVGRVLSGSRVVDPRPTGSADLHADGSRGQVTRPTVQLRGWKNEVRDIDTNGGASTRRRSGRLRWIWLREFVRFSKSFSGVLVGLMRFMWFRVWKRRKGFNGAGEDVNGRLRRPRTGDSVSGHVSDWVSNEVDKQRSERELYHRFLRGEDISDDDDDDVVIDENGGESTTDSGEGEDDTGLSTALDRAVSALGEEFDQHEKQEEAIGLFTDLVRCQGVDEGSRLVWGHLARTTGREGPSGPPLTRNRWSEMRRRWGLGFVNEMVEDIWEVDGTELSRLDNGGSSENGPDADWTDRTMCIICTGRPREIISWPCR